MERIVIIGQTTDGRTFSSSWNHRVIADKVELFLKIKHQNIVVYQVISNESN